ncbi:hypothetical protein pb186bvf_003984 [Paramecium bursaria]
MQSTVYADVEYFDDKGNFDVKKFIEAAGDKVTKEHQEKARNMMIQYNQKCLEQKRIRDLEKLQVKVRQVENQNTVAEKNKLKLQHKLKTFQKVINEAKQDDKIKITSLEKPKNYKKMIQNIDIKIDKLSPDQISINLYKFNQMEKNQSNIPFL